VACWGVAPVLPAGGGPVAGRLGGLVAMLDMDGDGNALEISCAWRARRCVDCSAMACSSRSWETPTWLTATSA